LEGLCIDGRIIPEDPSRSKSFKEGIELVNVQWWDFVNMITVKAGGLKQTFQDPA
jgi:hypothetical protein